MRIIFVTLLLVTGSDVLWKSSNLIEYVEYRSFCKLRMFMQIHILMNTNKKIER